MEFNGWINEVNVTEPDTYVQCPRRRSSGTRGTRRSASEHAGAVGTHVVRHEAGQTRREQS